MRTCRTALLSAIAIPALALAQSSNVDLFSFVMADAQLVAGANVDSARNSPFGQFVLSQIPIGEKYLQGFMTETGIDPLSDVTEVVAAWNGAPERQWPLVDRLRTANLARASRPSRSMR